MVIGQLTQANHIQRWFSLENSMNFSVFDRWKSSKIVENHWILCFDENLYCFALVHNCRRHLSRSEFLLVRFSSGFTDSYFFNWCAVVVVFLRRRLFIVRSSCFLFSVSFLFLFPPETRTRSVFSVLLRPEISVFYSYCLYSFHYYNYYRSCNKRQAQFSSFFFVLVFFFSILLRLDKACH